MAKQLVGTKYADMSEDYKSRVSKKEYRQRKQSQRMAGEAVAGGQTKEEYQKGAFDVDSLDQFDARRAGAGSAFGKGSTEDKMGRGANRFSKADAKGLFKQGFSAEEIQKYAAGQEGKDGFIFGNNAQAFLQKKIAKAQNSDGDSSGSNGGGDDGSGDGTGGSTGGGTGGDGSGVNDNGTTTDSGTSVNSTAEQTQIIDQDNDQSSVINGNNNYVNQSQDNSIRQYGGDTRNFVYNGGSGGGLNDSPVSAATMGGLYDVDDSPASQKKFNDTYTTMNRDNQKRYAGTAMDTFMKFGKLDARGYTPQAMDTQIGRSIQDSFDRADRQTGLVMGDIWNDNYTTGTWKPAGKADEIKSNADEIADKAKDDIENV